MFSCAHQPSIYKEDFPTKKFIPNRFSSRNETFLEDQLKLFEKDLEKIFEEKNERSEIRKISTILLTGATGFVGGFLLWEILNSFRDRCKIIILVRCPENVDPLDRVRSNLEFLGLWNENFVDQLVVLRADLEKTNFSLSEEKFDELSRSVDLIFHCASVVNFVFPFEKLVGPNVFSTIELIRLAWKTGGKASFFLISSTSSARPIDSLRSGYSQTKWLSEKLVEKSVELGFRGKIIRLGEIFPSEKNGAANRNDFQILFFATILKLKVFREDFLEFRFHGFPADGAAREILQIAENSMDSEQILFELSSDEKSFSFGKFVDAARSFGFDLNQVDDELWKSKTQYDSFASTFLLFSLDSFRENSSRQNQQDEQIFDFLLRIVRFIDEKLVRA